MQGFSNQRDGSQIREGSQSHTYTLPTVSLPKGGGAIKGIDEKFTVNAINGTNSATVPLPIASARSGFSPSLSLSYSSGFGNSPFGFGWQVGIPSIKRKTERELPHYKDEIESDTFILSGAEDLVPLLKRDDVTGKWNPEIRETVNYWIKQYRPRIEGLWAKIEQWKSKDTGEIHWRTISPDNVTSFYGIDGNSRIADPSDENLKIFEWKLSHTFDDRGNLIIYKYKREDFVGVPNAIFEKNRSSQNCTNLYLKKALYGNKTPYRKGDALPSEDDFLFETVLDYGGHDPTNPLPNPSETWDTRPDAFSFFRSGFDIRTYRICKRILLFHKFDELPINPYLVNSLELGYEDFPGKEQGEDHLEGFTYLKTITQRGYLYNSASSQYSSKILPPLSYYYQPHEWNTDIKLIKSEDINNAPIGIDFDRYRWIDLYTEGLSGILSEMSEGWYYKRNLGHGDFTAATLVTPKPSFTGVATGKLQIQDLEGVGDQYLVNWNQPPQGFFRFTDDETWQSFRHFEAIPSRNLVNDRNTRFIDLNGDGVPDLLITEDEFFEWHESKGEKGFGAANFIRMPLNEEQSPRLVFSEAEQTIFLADMSGDGLTDIVRIRNGEICYWANLGYGRFSMKITMENAPYFEREENFNPAFLKLVDIDGSGTTDLIYLGKNDVRIWLNLNGNSWTTPAKIISPFPRIDNLADISVLDLLGTGTSCLVWSSPLPSDSYAPLRYIDLMNSKKPHLLNFYENNMGKEVSFDYLPSTHFYLEDRKLGQPWATKLPFPVHVVASVRVEDKIRETVFTSSYSYHHGYFDGKEREFRGFGRIEQLDTEKFSTFSLNNAQNVVEEKHHQPPVKTVTWFHTGAALQKTQLTEIYQEEFYQNEALSEYSLPTSSLPDNLSTQEWCEALRACKGLTIRQEVYAKDSTDRQPHPYSTSQSTYEIRLVQPLEGNKYASFQIISQESISYTYDRRPADPRIAHTVTLETDDKGFVTKSASVVYPRVLRPAGIPDVVWNEQNKRHIVYSETDYTSDLESDDIYRLRVSYENRSYELLAATSLINSFLTRKNLLTWAQTAADIPFDDDGDGSLQKRLFSHGRLYFLRNDLNGGLSLGQWESLGLVYRSLQLAFTPGLISTHYGGKVTPGMLIQAGYEHSEGDNNWWIPSGISLYPLDASNRFYIAEGARDALGSETHVTYDSYILLPESTTDAISNTITVQNDYRTLSPILVTDPNQNRSAVETDELGLVIKSAVMGKAGANEGDTLAEPTARMEYDFFNWINHQKPNYAHTFAREVHGASNPRWQESYVYSDGGGGAIMSKIQAEPGKAKRWNPETQQVEEIETNTRWVGNGRVILNNKGNPIKQYEPYFSTTHEYEFAPELLETGVTPIIYYDPIGRNIRTELPNGTFTKVEFDPWHSQSYDPNDTVKDSRWYLNRGAPNPLTDPEPNNPEQRAAWLAAKHDNTPVIVHTDSLGRTIYSVADYGNGKTTSVHTEKDMVGRYSKIFDQLQREVALGYSNLVGAAIHSESAEKGENWIFQDVLGRMVRIWDNNLREFRTTYDLLHRPVSAFVLENRSEILFNHTVYGETHPNAEAFNLRGLAYQIYDQAGVTTVKQVDFKGNPLEIERRLTREYKQTINWQTLEGLTDINVIANTANSHLEGENFTGTASFDALNRPTEAVLPDGTIMRPRYNEANYLDFLEAQIMGQGDFITFLENQDHNARGQRERVKYGNGTLTKYFYDPNTFRLTNLLTTQQEGDAVTASLQNLKYTYDPVGNITQLVDDAQQTHYFRNNVVKPQQNFEYDAIYQLIKATGREHAGIGGNAQRNQNDLPFIAQLPHLNNASAVRTYTETYEYDDLGNILLMRHIASDILGNWTRRYRYEYQDDPTNRTNRLATTSLPGDSVSGPFSATYSHDLHGNMTQMPHLQNMVWNFLDHLKEIGLGGGGIAFYVCGISGMRRRKVIERNGGRRIERIYLGAVEIYREYAANGILELERWTVHISDDSGRIAQVDTKTIDTGNTDPVNALNASLIRFQYSNHLGSATLETDGNGNVISYEEYHPYGTSAYRSSKSNVDLSLKRYRFSGKERDDETGLHYFGARYYAAWLGRWTSSDPAGFVRGVNLFRYCSNNPVMFHDPNGLEEYETLWNYDPNELSKKDRDIIDNPKSDSAAVLKIFEGQGYQGGGPLEWRDDFGGWVRTKPPEGEGGEGATVDSSDLSEETGEATQAAKEDKGDIQEESSEEGSKLGPALTHSGPALEKYIWSEHFGKRGFRLEHLYSNDIPNSIRAKGDNRPLYDKETNKKVKQIKSTLGKNDKTTRAQASKATRDAGKAISKNPTKTMTGKSPQAVVITPTDAPASTGADIRAGYDKIRKPVTNSLSPEHVRGLPGIVGAIGRGMTFAGTGLSAYALYSNLTGDDVDIPMAIGDTLGFAGGALEIYAIAVPGATVAGVSAMIAGLAVGGVGIAVTSAVSGIRAYQAGNVGGTIAGGFGFLAGGAITAGALGVAGIAAIPAAPLLLGLGIVAAIGVGIFHVGRYFDLW